MQCRTSALATFARCRSGSIALIAAAGIPLMLLMASGAIDFAYIYKQRSVLQSAADSAAIAGARGLSMSDAKRENVAEVVKVVVNGFVKNNKTSRADQLTVATKLSESPLEVSVDVTQTVPTFFGKMFGMGDVKVQAHATARIIGQPNICLLGLNRFDGGTIMLEKAARLTGVQCAVFSNSSHNDSIKSKEQSHLSAYNTCARGGFEGDKRNFNPMPMVDCPRFDDPLAGRPEPPATGCTFKDPVEIESDRNLQPGIYCGGLYVKKSAKVTLSPGLYVMKDGPLVVTDEAELISKGAGIFFTGNGADLLFDRDTTIKMEAPTSGVMSGLLFFSSRRMATETFKILSNNARTLIGTIYLPNGRLLVETENPVADKSAFTAVIADTVHLIGKPNLVLNTNFNQTTVPVPNGIRGVGQPVRLWK